MTRRKIAKDERMFSIELRSKMDVKDISLEGNEKVLIEGSIGSFVRARFLDDLILEVIGSNGEMRIDLSVKDLHLRPCKAEGPREEGEEGQ